MDEQVQAARRRFEADRSDENRAALCAQLERAGQRPPGPAGPGVDELPAEPWLPEAWLGLVGEVLAQRCRSPEELEAEAEWFASHDVFEEQIGNVYVVRYDTNARKALAVVELEGALWESAAGGYLMLGVDEAEEASRSRIETALREPLAVGWTIPDVEADLQLRFDTIHEAIAEALRTARASARP